MDEQTVNEQDTLESSEVLDQDNEQGESVDNSAVEETNEQPASEENNANESMDNSAQEMQTGDTIDDFLAKKGVDLSDPDAIRKIGKMYQDAEKGLNQAFQEKAQLERRLQESTEQLQNGSDSEAEMSLADVNANQAKQEAEQWMEKVKPSPEVEQKMIEYLSQPILKRDGTPVLDANNRPIPKGYQLVGGLITLDEVYKIVGGGVDEVQNLTNDLRNEIKKEMSARQNAKSLSSTSTNSAEFGKPDDNSDDFLKGFRSGN